MLAAFLGGWEVVLILAVVLLMGIAFVVAQGVAVALFAGLEYVGLRAQDRGPISA